MIRVVFAVIACLCMAAFLALPDVLRFGYEHRPAWMSSDIILFSGLISAILLVLVSLFSIVCAVHRSERD